MKIVVSGGGTGGHIYPALALVKEIQKTNEDAKFLYIGSMNGLEEKLVARENISFEAIKISGFKRKISLDNVKTVTNFLKAVAKCKKMLKEFQPDVVIGTGGYVCGPVVYAAAKLKIPTIIHEQNSVPGLTNKFLSKFVDKVAICFEEAATYFPSNKVVFTGNPRASEVVGQDGMKGRLSLGLSTTKPLVTIFGGSRGAKPINDAVLNMLPNLKNKEYQVLYITGDVHFEKVISKVKEIDGLVNVKVVPFIYNMPEVLASTDVCVSRAGATTLAELTVLGIPSILIPSPYVTNNHQVKNAESLKKQDAAKIILEPELTDEVLLETIESIILDKEKTKQMKENAMKLGVPNATTKLVEVIEQLMKK